MDRLKSEAIVCANDRTAGQVMHSLIELNYQIPKDVRIVGIDDVQYASLLPVPLTTVHQPCREIGMAAVAAMLERIALPNMPAHDILLDCKLVVRSSCGAHTSVGEAASESRRFSG
jgi:DNA-binding LacI/PurR family transcriptional regulator